jgi:hypothetical protein
MNQNPLQDRYRDDLSDSPVPHQNHQYGPPADQYNGPGDIDQANQTLAQLLDTYSSPRQENKNVLEDYRSILDNFYSNVNSDGSTRTAAVVKNPLPSILSKKNDRQPQPQPPQHQQVTMDDTPTYIPPDDASLFYPRQQNANPVINTDMERQVSQQPPKPRIKKSIDFLKTATGSYGVLPDPIIEDQPSKPYPIDQYKDSNPYRQSYENRKLNNPDNIKKRNSSNNLSFNFIDPKTK